MDSDWAAAHSARMVLPATLVALWLLGNLVAVAVWALHRGVLTPAADVLPQVALPAPRAAADAVVLQPSAFA